MSAPPDAGPPGPAAAAAAALFGAGASSWGPYVARAVAVAAAAVLLDALLPAARPLQVQLTLDLRAVAVLVAGACLLAPLLAAGPAGRATETAAAAGGPHKPPPAGPAPSGAAAPGAAGGAGSGGEGGERPAALLPDVPDELLRAFATWRPPAAAPGSEEDGPLAPAEVEELEQRHRCPSCKDVMLFPRQLACKHHACGACLQRLAEVGAQAAGRPGTAAAASRGGPSCPRCSVAVDLKALQDPAPELAQSLAARRCGCGACGSFEGTLDALRVHLLVCRHAQGELALRLCRLALEAERRRGLPAAVAEAAVEALRADMLGASPALVHRFPADAVARHDGSWVSPPFAAFGRLFSLRLGAVGGGAAEGVPGGSARFFCLIPQGHQERLRCNLYFARRPGEGFTERRVHDWPAELAGHPWGPTVRAQELEQLKQADGSVLVMIHAVGLGADPEEEAAMSRLAKANGG